MQKDILAQLRSIPELNLSAVAKAAKIDPVRLNQAVTEQSYIMRANGKEYTYTRTLTAAQKERLTKVLEGIKAKL